jgi:hypothetical protein
MLLEADQLFMCAAAVLGFVHRCKSSKMQKRVKRGPVIKKFMAPRVERLIRSYTIPLCIFESGVLRVGP